MEVNPFMLAAKLKVNMCSVHKNMLESQTKSLQDGLKFMQKNRATTHVFEFAVDPELVEHLESAGYLVDVMANKGSSVQVGLTRIEVKW